MGKHHRQSKFVRNASIFGATVAGVSVMAMPAANANPLQDAIGGFLPNIQGALPSGAGAAAPSISEGQRIVDAARSQIGTPYVWGGTEPGGFDCSGLTSWSYRQVGKSIPRTSQDQAAGGQRVNDAARQLGDIVVFYPGATHVGIYSGGNNVIHAPTTGQTVHEASIDYMPVHSTVRF